MATDTDRQPAIIAIMGYTGVGKSSFINTVTKSHKLPVGHQLDSCTKEVQEVHLKWGFPINPNAPCQIVRRSMINGVIYMHRIADGKVEGGTRRIIKLLQELFGSTDLRRVVIVTTWWDKVDGKLAVERETQLRDGKSLFKPMLTAGAKMMRHEMRHDQGFSSAQRVLNHLLRLNTLDLEIQAQLVKDEKIRTERHFFLRWLRFF